MHPVRAAARSSYTHPTRHGTCPINTLIEFFATVPDVSPWGAVGFYVLSFFTAGITTVAGLGGGLLLIGALAAVYPPSVVIPIHGIIQIGSNGGRALVMYRHIMVRFVPPFVAGSVIGVVAGANVFVALPTAVLQAILGSFILFILWGPRIGGLRPNRRTFFGLGIAATFASLFVGVTGPLFAPFLAVASGDRREVVSTHASMMVMLHIFKITAFSVMGFAFAPYAGLVVGMIATGFIGTLTGRYLLYRIPERAFRIAFKAVMTLLALRLLWQAVG